MPRSATETASPDRATIAKVALKAYNTWAGLPTLQQMSFNHPSLGEMIADAVLAALPTPPAAAQVEWEQAKWHELKADDQETGAPEGDTIRLAWENGTVLVGRLTVPSVGAGHQQVCRMQTVFGGDTFVFPHGATLTRKVREVQS